MWLGRFKLGDNIKAAALCPDALSPNAPLAAPTLSVYSSAGSKVYAGKIAPLDPYGVTGAFSIALRLGNTFAAGQYRWALNWNTSGGSFRVQAGHFQVVDSGNASGNYVAGYFYQRPQATFLIARTDADSRIIARNPYE